MRSCGTHAAMLLAGLALFASVAVSPAAAQCNPDNFVLEGDLQTALWPNEPGETNFAIELNPILKNINGLTVNMLGLQMVFDYDRSLANGGTGVLEFFDTDCFYSYIPDFNFANLCDSLNIQITPENILVTFVENQFICPDCVVMGQINVPNFVNEVFILVKSTAGDELVDTISFKEFRCVSLDDVLRGPNQVIEGHMETNNALAWWDTNFNGIPNPANVNELSTEQVHTGESSRKIVTGSTVHQGTLQEVILDTTKEYVVEAYIFVASGGPVSLLMNSEVIGDTGSSISEWIMISTEDYVPSGAAVILTIRSNTAGSTFYIDDVGVFEARSTPLADLAPPPTQSSEPPSPPSPPSPPPPPPSPPSPPSPPISSGGVGGCCTGNPEVDPFCCQTNECCPTIFGTFLGCCDDPTISAPPFFDECTLSEYSEFTPCSQSCGSGVAGRTKTFISGPSLGSTSSYDCLPLSDYQSCNLGPCEDGQCSTYLNFTVDSLLYPTVELTEDPDSEFHFNTLPATQLAFRPFFKNTADSAIYLKDIEIFIHHSLYTLDFLNNWIVSDPEEFMVQCWSGSIIGPIPDFTNICDYMKFEILQTGIRITFESGMLCAGCELYTTPNTEENLIFLFTLHHKDYYQIDPAFGVSEEICVPPGSTVPPSYLVRSPFSVGDRDLFPAGECPCGNLFDANVFCSDMISAEVFLESYPTLPDILSPENELFGYTPNGEFGIVFNLKNEGTEMVALNSAVVPIGWSMGVETAEKAFPLTNWVQATEFEFIITCLDVVIIDADGQPLAQQDNLCNDSSKFAIVIKPWGIEITIQSMTLCPGCSISAGSSVNSANPGSPYQYIATIKHQEGHTMDVRTTDVDYVCIATDEVPVVILPPSPPSPPSSFFTSIVLPGGPPSDLPLQNGLVLHLDAAVGVETFGSEANLVLLWPNLAQSEEQNLLLPETTVITSKSNPELSTYNNMPALYFDGGDSITVLDAAASINPENMGYTVMIVAVATAEPSDEARVWISKGNNEAENAESAGYSIFESSGDLISRVAAQDGGSSQVDVAARRYQDLPKDEIILHSTFLSGSELTSRLNSSTLGWAAGASSSGVPNGKDSYTGDVATNSEIIIGNTVPGGSNGFKGYILEIAIFAKELSGVDRKIVEQFFVNKYGLSDPEPPKISVNGGKKPKKNEHPLCTPYSDPGVTIDDNLDFAEDLIGSLNVFGSFPLDITKLGIQRVKYRVEDSAGNKSPVAVRKVRIVEEGGNMDCVPDTEKPVITLIGSKKASKNQVQQGWPFEDPGVTITDNRDDSEVLLANLEIGGADLSDTMTPGVYKITYDVVDEAGNKAKRRKRSVKVVEDDVDPELSVVGSPFVYMYIHVDPEDDNDGLIREDFVDQGAQAYDLRLSSQAFDVDLSDNVTSSITGKKGGAIDSIKMSKAGQYTVKYEAMDRVGNKGKAQRAVKVGSALPTVDISEQGEGGCVKFYFTIALDDNADKYSWTLEYPDESIEDVGYKAKHANTIRVREIELCNPGRYVFRFKSEDGAELCCGNSSNSTTGYYYGQIQDDVVFSSPLSTWSSGITHRFRLKN